MSPQQKNNPTEKEEENRKIKSNHIFMKTGNIFETTEDIALIHCVAEDLHMSDRIARTFREKYAEEEIENLLQQNEKKRTSTTSENRCKEHPTYNH